MSSAMASHAGRRQALAAQNMANVDTPGYQAQRLPSFAAAMNDTGARGSEGGLNMRATRATHLSGVSETAMQVRLTQLRDMPAPNGNTASVEREMLESVGAKREHDRAMAIYKSGLNILTKTLGKN